MLVVVGMGASHNIELPLFNALSREVDIKGIFRYANEYIYRQIKFIKHNY